MVSGTKKPTGGRTDERFPKVSYAGINRSYIIDEDVSQVQLPMRIIYACTNPAFANQDANKNHLHPRQHLVMQTKVRMRIICTWAYLSNANEDANDNHLHSLPL